MNAVTELSRAAMITTISQADANALKAGDPVGGGFYVGQIRQADSLYILIVAPKDGGEHEGAAWNATTKRVEDARSFFDGNANTIAMGVAGSAIALWAIGLGIDGFNDWYLPARDELELVYRNLKPSTEGNYVWRAGDNPSSVPAGYPYTADSPAQTAIAAFQAGGAEALDDESYYWTSTQSESNSGNAWFQDFGGGGQDGNHKDGEFRARAVRRMKVQ
ncbi:DUF1566 domain-containing protein [Cupriavidus sp. UBA2534]|uniref:Lcl domain-containing protein n=1 Tax=Cupriavidus sp. UBA2534 TaxID=1946399 RepID=UPI00257FBEFF|nr:DUF1566 domain-containing protein [Cupriavidus sp. UBA2534]